MRQRAEHPAHACCAACGRSRRWFSGFPGRCADRRHSPTAQTHMRRISAPDCLITSWGATTLPSDFDILRPCSSSTKPCVSTDIERRAAARAAAFDQRRMKPAAVLVRAFQIHHRYPGRRRRLRLMPASRGKCIGSSSTKACVEPESNQTSQMSSTFFHVLVGAFAEEALARAGPCTRRRRLPASKASAMRMFTSAIVEDIDRAVRPFLAHEYRNRHAPGALPRDHPVGLGLDHAGDAVLAGRRHPARHLDRPERAMRATYPLAALSMGLIHRDEPLRRVAEDDRLLRTPRVRILMLEAAARDDVAGFGQSLDHGLVGVALLALVIDDTLALEARRSGVSARRSHRRYRE